MYCISGFSGTGKDEAAGRLVSKHGAVQTGLADPAKRHMADLYGFTQHQLFGPSSARNGGDLRYPKELFFQLKMKASLHMLGEYGKIESTKSGSKDTILHIPGIQGQSHLLRDHSYWVCEGRDLSKIFGDRYAWQPLKLGNARYFIPEGDPLFWLSPRETLQRYCELMNQLYLRSWSRKGIETHKKLAEVSSSKNMSAFKYKYSQMHGLVEEARIIPFSSKAFKTCFADFRHVHEIAEADSAESKSLTPVLIRVKRPSVPEPPYQHRSETEQLRIPDEAFDYIVNNDGSLEDLYAKVDKIVQETENKKWSKRRTVAGASLT